MKTPVQEQYEIIEWYIKKAQEHVDAILYYKNDEAKLRLEALEVNHAIYGAYHDLNMCHEMIGYAVRNLFMMGEPQIDFDKIFGEL